MSFPFYLNQTTPVVFSLAGLVNSGDHTALFDQINLAHTATREFSVFRYLIILNYPATSFIQIINGGFENTGIQSGDIYYYTSYDMSWYGVQYNVLDSTKTNWNLPPNTSLRGKFAFVRALPGEVSL